jgi:hypothetical protein
VPYGEVGLGVLGAPSVGDIRRSDLVLGILTAMVTLGATAIALASVEITVLDEPSILEPGEIAVAVRPVSAAEVDGERSAAIDLPSVTPPPTSDTGPLGAAPVPPRPANAPAPVPREALPERPQGGIRSLPRLESPTRPSLPGVGDEPGFGPGGPAIAPGDADPATSPRDPYAYVDPATEDPSASGPGVVSDDEGAGTDDPLAARALAAYRQRLQRWLSRHFYVTGSGLSKEALRKVKVRATVEIAEDRTVVGTHVAPGAHPAIEAAARRALDQVMGQPVPELPEHYPGPLQRSISVTFTCTEETCN